MNGSDIEEETQLVEYTNDHFVNKLKIALEQFRGEGGSGSGSGSGSDIEFGNKPRFRKLTYNDVLKSFDQYVVSCKYSNELDLIVAYLDGQRQIYGFANRVTNLERNMLLVPAISLASLVMLFAPFITHFIWSGALISAINSIVVMLVVLMSYLKLETSAQIFIALVDRYSQLHATLETANSKLMFLENNIEQLELTTCKIREIEDKLADVKTKSHMMPAYLKALFPIIHEVNIFSFVKRVETYKTSLVVRYRDVKNEIRFIRHNGGENKDDKKTRLRFLLDMKEKIKDEIIQHKNAYGEICGAFAQEIKNAEARSLAGVIFVGVNDKPAQYDTNSIIYRHL